MSVLDRAALEQSPLADLHAIASELSLDGYRRLRKAELIDAILERQGGEDAAAQADEADAGREEASGRRRRGRRGGRSRGSKDADVEAPEDDAPATADDEGPSGRGSRSGRTVTEEAPEQVAEGVVELLPNGSGFLRVDPPDPSDEDIYVSAAQVRRCELVSGDRVTGPRRPPRRSERFASLIRVDTINGRPAAEVADSARFEDLPAAFPSERLPLEADDLTLTAIAGLAPIGRGSRVTIVGGAQSGKSEALRRLAGHLAREDDLQLSLVLVGVRPEEVPEWRSGPVEPAVVLTLSASADSQAQAVEGVVEQARRVASRGTNSVVLIDGLDALSAPAARRILASARNLLDSGSVTVIATAPAPIGGETTVISMDPALARTEQFPAIDPAATWTMRRELLEG